MIELPSGSTMVLRSTLPVPDHFPVFWCPAQQEKREKGLRPHILFKFPAWGVIKYDEIPSFVAFQPFAADFPHTESGSDPFSCEDNVMKLDEIARISHRESYISGIFWTPEHFC